jgi:uncharacterized protein
VAPSRFVTDSSLELLARRLRVLGYDVETHRGARLAELFEAARRGERTVLTLSEKRPRSRNAADAAGETEAAETADVASATESADTADVPAITVPRGDPALALRSIAAAHEAAGAPFSRCTLCNTALQRRMSFEARGEVPGAVLRGAESLGYCPNCGKWYWDGSHVARLRAWLEAALGRAI